MKASNRIAAVIKSNEKDLLSDWIKEQLAAKTSRGDLLKESDLREQSRAFLSGLQTASQKGIDDLDGPAWAEVRHHLSGLSRSRALAGFSPSETATFVFSLKQPLFSRLRSEIKDPETLGEEMWNATVLLDKL